MDMDHSSDDDCTGCAEYRELSRRQFVGTAAGAAAASVFPAWLPRVVMAKSHASNRDVMVSVFQRGGADGLSICAPFGDPAYYAARPTIAIPQPDAANTATRGIALDNFFAFPRAMAGLVPAYQAADLLVIHATGQLNNSRSHFDAQRYMEVGKPVDPGLVTGWLGRHLASTEQMKPGAPLRAIGISSGLQKTLVGGPNTLPIADPANYTIGGTQSTAAARLALVRADYDLASEPLRSAALDAVNTVNLLQSVNIAGYVPANGAVYPNSGFGRALRSVAALIKADVGIEAAQVDIGNWDTHSAQDPIAGSMYLTMLDFANALAAFHADVIAPASVGVTLISLSEFGRNVKENGSLGTDHGRGTSMLAMGKGIAGGRVLTNGWPGLATANLDSGRDLKVTLDYRDVLAEIVQNRLGNSNLSFVFPGWTPTFRGVTRA
jgi:uncharacterized protein (DUF1501 family)